MSHHGGLSDTAASVRQAQEYLRAIAAARSARDQEPSGKGASLLCMTGSAGSYPTVAQSVYLLIPCELDADDAEGATASPAPDADQGLYGANVGSAVPTQGTLVIAHHVGGSLCFRFDG